MDDYPQELLDSYVTRTSRSRRSLGDSTSSLQSRQSLRTVPVSTHTRIPHPTAPSSAPIPTESSQSSVPNMLNSSLLLASGQSAQKLLSSSTHFIPNFRDSLPHIPPALQTSQILSDKVQYEPPDPPPVYNLQQLNNVWGDFFRFIDYVITVRDNINNDTRTPEGYHNFMLLLRQGYYVKQASKTLDTVLCHAPDLKPELLKFIATYFMTMLEQDEEWQQAHGGFNLGAKKTLWNATNQLLSEGMKAFGYYIGAMEGSHMEDVDETGELKKTYAHI